MPECLLRKASDLLHNVSGKFLNIDPSLEVKVGYFGGIDRHSGEFNYNGNVYEDDEFKEVMKDVKNSPQEGKIQVIEAIRSETAVAWNFGVDPKVTLPGLLEGSAQLQLEVTPGKRAAFLIMQDVKTSFLPPEGLQKLARVEALTNKWLVTRTVLCSSYVLGITHKGEQSVSANVGAMVPVGGPFVAGGSVGAGLHMSNAYGFYLKGERQVGGSAATGYVMLLHLQLLRPTWLYKCFGIQGPYRDSLPADDPTLNESTAWKDAPLPWDILDEDEGEEQTPVDNYPSDYDSDVETKEVV